MPIQIRVMSWNIQKKRTNAAYIAELMRVRGIDICALLEVPNSQNIAIPLQIVIALDNLAVAYHPHEWRFKSVEVGSESVTYIWHETAAVAPNAFRAERCVNAPLEYVAGPVMKNAANATIYFPTTKFQWASLPGRPLGRRPAFLSFLTNDGVGAARRFTVLDLHTPFNNDAHSAAYSIQSYATHLYASSREITAVEVNSATAAAQTASIGLEGALAGAVDPLLTAVAGYAAFVTPLRLRTNAVNDALAAIRTAIATNGADPQHLFVEAVNDGINAAVKAIGAVPAATISAADAGRLARGCAMAGAGAAAVLANAIQPVAAPPAAIGNVLATALAAIGANVSAYRHPAVPTSARIKDAIRTEAKRMARLALAAFFFPAPPQFPVDASIVAGDFNVHYPDATAYGAVAHGILGGANAYAALTAATAGGARNNATTTRIGPTAFEGQRVYTLRNPCPIQHLNNAAADYVPLDMSPLALAPPRNFMGNDAWINGLRALAAAQGRAWAPLTGPPYADRLAGAFDMEVINDTSFYRSNCYDNIFVRGAAFVTGGLIDVMSELGSWPIRAAALPNPQPALAHNPWPAAGNHLNGLARAQLAPMPAPIEYAYNTTVYTITPALQDAEEAAVFFDQFISDHLPVFVEVQI